MPWSKCDYVNARLLIRSKRSTASVSGYKEQPNFPQVVPHRFKDGR